MIKSPKFCLPFRFCDYNFVFFSLPYVSSQYYFISIFLSSIIPFLLSILTLKYYLFTLNFVRIQHFGTLNATLNDRILNRVEQNEKFLNPAISKRGDLPLDSCACFSLCNKSSEQPDHDNRVTYYTEKVTLMLSRRL